MVVMPLELFSNSLSSCVNHDRAGAQAPQPPQQQAQQQAQPSGELSDNGEENTAPQPQPDDAGAESVDGQHCEGRHPRSQHITLMPLI